MKTESKWELMIDAQPSDQFICTYGGPFAQRMLIDRGQIEQFLSIASLDGRILLQESKVRLPRAVPEGINPDGSVTGRGSLRWGQKIYDNGGGKTQNPYFQVEPDDAGWTVSVNGGLIMDRLMERGNLSAREVENKTVKKINYYIRVGLREALLKDKCTTLKDPYKYGRIVSSALTSVWYGLTLLSPNFWFAGGIAFFGNTGITFLFKKAEELKGTYDPRISPLKWDNRFTQRAAFSHFHNGWRLTVKSDLDTLGLPFEIDRLGLAYGYLDWKKYTGSPLIRATD